MYSPRPTDATFQEIAKSAHPLLKQGMIIMLKWTCPLCGERVTATDPLKLIDHPGFPGHNVKMVAFPPGYRHDERHDGKLCGQLVDIRLYKFNYVLITGTGDMSWIKESESKNAN